MRGLTAGRGGARRAYETFGGGGSGIRAALINSYERETAARGGARQSISEVIG
jgi:hypothetical protein